MPFLDFDRGLVEGVPVSPREAVTLGKRVIYGPFVPIYLLHGAAMWYAVGQELVLPLLALLVSMLVTPWLWWSYATPRWRRWAHARGADPDRLQQLAEREKLVWPRGHIFERTEFSVRELPPSSRTE